MKWSSYTHTVSGPTNLPSWGNYSLMRLLSHNNIFIHIFAYMLSRFNHVLLCVTLGTAAHQAPLPMGFSRQEYWSGLPCPPLGILPHPGIVSKFYLYFVINHVACNHLMPHITPFKMCILLGQSPLFIPANDC